MVGEQTGRATKSANCQNTVKSSHTRARIKPNFLFGQIIDQGADLKYLSMANGKSIYSARYVTRTTKSVAKSYKPSA